MGKKEKIEVADVEEMIECFKEVSDVIPKRKIPDYLGHVNEMFLFLEKLKRIAAKSPIQ